MRRLSSKTLLALSVVGLAAAVLPSCATSDSMMYIEGVAVLKQGSCTLKPQFGGALLARGTMDRLLATDYIAGLVIGNQLVQRGSRERLRTETSHVALKGAEVRLENTQGKLLVPSFSAIGTGFVEASDGSSATPAGMFVSIIPASVAPKLPPGTVVSKVRVFGTTLGGEEVESAELLFPIEICDGCLVQFPSTDRDLTADGDDYQCKLATDDKTTANEDVDKPCNLGVDFPVSCTACSGLYDFCRSPKDNPYYQ